MSNPFETLTEDKKREKKKQQEQLESNRNALDAIIKNLREWENTILDSRLKRLRRTPYYFPPEDVENIKQIIKNLEGAGYRWVENPEIKFHSGNNVAHLIGNGVQTYSRLVDMYLARNAKVEGELADKNPIDLGPNELRWMSLNKEAWDLTLYYISCISDEKNGDVFLAEVAGEEGYLEKKEIENLFIKSEDGEPKFPQEDMAKLQVFNFLMRVEGRESNVSHLRGLNKIANLITEENFEEEFSKLNSKAQEFLDKEKVEEFLKKCLAKRKETMKEAA